MSTEKRDPLATMLGEHIWYTTTTRAGKGTLLICKCRAEMSDTWQHEDHIARLARDFIKASA